MAGTVGAERPRVRRRPAVGDLDDVREGHIAPPPARSRPRLVLAGVRELRADRTQSVDDGVGRLRVIDGHHGQSGIVPPVELTMRPDGEQPHAMTSSPVIDADGHVLEPRSAWADLDASIRPRIETDARGLDHVIVGDDEVFVAKLGQMGTPGTDVSTGATEPFPLERARAGSVRRRRPPRRHGLGRDRRRRPLPHDRAGLLGDHRPRRGRADRPGVQRLAGVLLRGRPGPLPGGGDGAVPVAHRSGRANCAGRARSSGSSPRSSARTRASVARSSTTSTSRSGPPPRSSAIAIGVHEGFQPAVPRWGATARRATSS